MGGELDCYRVGCTGTLAYYGDDDSDTLYECRECDTELSQEYVAQLAEDDGPIAKLAKVLLAGYYEED